MIDEKLYRETFSRLQASGEAKKEVLLKMNETGKTRRPLKALRVLALAAALTLALAVTANAASNGELFKTLRIIWQDGSSIMMEDEQGNHITVTTGGYTNVEVRDGKLSVEGVGDDGTSANSMMIGRYTMDCGDGTEVEVKVTEVPEDIEFSTEGAVSYSVNVASGTAEVSYSKNSDTAAAESPAAEDTTTYKVVTGND